MGKMYGYIKMEDQIQLIKYVSTHATQSENTIYCTKAEKCREHMQVRSPILPLLLPSRLFEEHLQ
jgi:hypothetical protein